MIGGTHSKRGQLAASILTELVSNTIVNVMYITGGLPSVTDPLVIVHNRTTIHLGMRHIQFHVTLNIS